MNPQDKLDIESTLTQFAPGLPASMRDRMLFAAGQEAAHVAQQRVNRWQLGTTAVVTGLLTISLTWISQPLSQSSSEALVSNSGSLPTDPTETSSDNLTKKQLKLVSQIESTTARFFTLNDAFSKGALNDVDIQPVSNRMTLTPRSSLDL